LRFHHFFFSVMIHSMTLATRNRFVLSATIISAVLVLITGIATVVILIQNRLPAQIPGIRQISGLDDFFLTPYSPLASILTLNVFPVIALCSLLYMLVAFEKTQSIEITFFAACAFALAFEGLRICIPLYGLWDNSNFYLMTVARSILACRIFILLAILSSGLFTTGATSQQLGSALFLEAFFSFTLARAIPLNARSVSSNFLLLPGYDELLGIVFLTLGLLSILVYLILAKTRGIPEYRAAAAGLALMFCGYPLLAASDTWVILAAGTCLMVAGGALFLKKIHTFYLWQ